MFKTVKALVLREVRYKEADRILTLLTDAEGKLTAKARGALRRASKTAAATQLLCFSELTVFEKAGRYTVNEASTIEEFKGLRESLSALALGSYFAECLDAFSQEGIAETGLLSLGLNSLYALSVGKTDEAQIKAAFEMRLMCECGYTPQIDACCVCGEENPEGAIFMVDEGQIACEKCRAAAPGAGLRLTCGALEALRYITCCEPKRLLSFKIDKESLSTLAPAAESYLLRRAERRFASLDYWRKVK